MVSICKLSQVVAIRSEVLGGRNLGRKLLPIRHGYMSFPVFQRQFRLASHSPMLAFAPSSTISASYLSTSSHSKQLHDEVTKQLFYAFAHPASGSKVEPYLDVDNLEEVLIALGERPSEKRLRNLINFCDTDKNGTIELEEFLQARKVVLSREQDRNSAMTGDMDALVKAFHTLDKNRDGVLCVDELTGLLSTAGGYLTKTDAEEIIHLADTSGNGVIDLSEFLRLMTDVTKSHLSWRLRSGFRAILIIGGPGSGKGTLCEKLVKNCHVTHLSSGDLLRKEVESDTALGRLCARAMAEGKLLPSTTVTALLRKAMARSPGSYVAIDGFPRSLENCMDFQELCGIPEFVVNIEVPDEVMVARILERGRSSGRVDDNLESAQQRLKTFHEQGRPTLEYLAKSGVKIYNLDGTQSPDLVWQQLLDTDTPLSARSKRFLT